MLAKMLAKISAAVRKFINSFAVISAESMPEFIRYLKNNKKPEISVFIHALHKGRDSWKCEVKFASAMEDGTGVLYKVKENMKVYGAGEEDTSNYVNSWLVYSHVVQQIRLIRTSMSAAEVSVYDTDGNEVDTTKLHSTRYRSPRLRQV